MIEEDGNGLMSVGDHRTAIRMAGEREVAAEDSAGGGPGVVRSPAFIDPLVARACGIIIIRLGISLSYQALRQADGQ